MKKCCKETYKFCLENFLNSIIVNEPSSVDEIVGVLQYALKCVNELEKGKNENN